MSVKSRIAHICFFLLAFCTCFILVQSILSSNSNNTRRMNGLYAEEPYSLDVLYVGASQIETFVSPAQIYDEYGFTGYDLCFDGTSIGLYELLIKEALRRQQPKVIVLDVIITDTHTNEQARAVLDNMRWSAHKRNAIKKYSDDPLWTFVFPISYYHNRWKNLSPALGYPYFMITENQRYKAMDSYSLADLYLKKIYPLKGFYTSGVVDETEVIPDWKMTTERLAPDENYMEMLNSLLDYLDTLDCEVVFINTPTLQADTSTTQKQINYVGDYLREKGYVFVDYCENPDEYGFDLSTDMGDGVHANIHGAIKFSNILGRYLSEEMKITPMEHTDKTITQWEKAVDVWHSCLIYYKIEEK